MLEKYILSIVKIEGLGDLSDSECSLSIDKKCNFTRPLDQLPVTFNIFSSGAISLSINDMNSATVLASLSFHSSLLQYDWFYWLPLSLSQDNYITELPENISLPRLLIGVNQEVSLPVLYDISEFSDSYEENNVFESFTPIYHSLENRDFTNDLSQGISKSDTSEFEEKIADKYEKIIKDLENELSKEKEYCKSKLKEMEDEIEKNHREIEFERKFRLEIQQKLEQSMRSYEKLRKREERFVRSVEKKPQKPVFETQTDAGFFILPDFQTLDDKTPRSNLSGKASAFDIIDRKVNELLMRLKLVGLLKKSREVNYNVGAKTITLCLKQGQVLCKNGMALDSYIFKNCKHEIEELLRNRAGAGKLWSAQSRSPLSTSRSPILQTHRVLRFNS